MGLDDDDFEGLLDDLPLDEELEQSLAQIEASFTPHSQQPQARNQQKEQESQVPGDSHSARAGHFVRPSIDSASRQTNGHPGPSRAKARAEVDVDDFRVSHPRQQGRPGLPPGDDIDDDDDDAAWNSMDLDRAESEAISLSQQSRFVAPTSSAWGAKRPRLSSEDESGLAASNAKKPEKVAKGHPHEQKLLIAELQRKLAAAEQDFIKLKREKQAKEGEASLLRTHLSKVTSQFSTQSREFERAKAEHKAILAKVDKDYKEQVSRTQLQYAFKHIEQATSVAANSWANITASVNRRRARLSDQRNTQAQGSQSQSFAAAYGLSTPTRRGRNQARNLDSGGSQGSGGGAHRTGVSRTEEDSPSGRLEKRARVTPAPVPSMPSKRTVAAFPGLVNSFATSTSAKKKLQAKTCTLPASSSPPRDDQVFEDDNQDLQAQEISAEQGGQPSSSGLHPDRTTQQNNESKTGELVNTTRPVSGWSSRQQRYLWAVSTYTKRQGYLASLVLTHSSKPCPGVDGEVTDKECKSYVSREPRDDIRRGDRPISMSTLHRIVDPNLAINAPKPVQEQYAMLTDLLLQAISQGAATDAEDRFAYLLNALDSDQDDLSNEQRSELQEEEFWFAYSEIELGINAVLLRLACVFKALAGIAMKLGMVTRLYDILRLTATLCSHHTSMEQCLQSRHPIVLSLSEEEMPLAETQAMTMSQAQLSSLLKLEYSLEDIIVESIRKLCLVESASANSTVAETPALSGDVINKAKSKPGSLRFEWRFSAEGREDVLATLLTLIEFMAWDSSENQRTHVKKVIETPGIIFALLSAQRRASTMHRTLGMLIYLCQHESMWRSIVACRPGDVLQKHLPNQMKQSQTPFLHLLAQHMVDRRIDMESKEAHKLHADIVVLLSQLVIAHPQDALLVLGDSEPILAALVKCMQLDTESIWSAYTRTCKDAGETVERLCMDTRLLAQLYLVDDEDLDTEDDTGVTRASTTMPKARPADLAQKILGHQCQALLNGIQHCFVVGLGRVAYAEVPQWLSESEKTALGEVGSLASELLNLVLAPDEVDAIWEALDDDDDDDDESASINDEEMESLTEGEDDDAQT